VPYRCLLPQDLDNLLVPVCLSCTHVGWGTLRLEPVWMHVGESAGHAAALALELGTLPGLLPVPRLQRRLVERGAMLSFFNEFDMATQEPWVPAIQYLGARGYFATYNAHPADLLDETTAADWSRRSGVTMGAGQQRGEACMRIYEAIAPAA
jgi:hypothetical protein